MCDLETNWLVLITACLSFLLFDFFFCYLLYKILVRFFPKTFGVKKDE